MDETSSMYKYVKLNRNANCFLPDESKDCKILLHMSREICRLEERHNLFSVQYRLSAGKPFPQNHGNAVYQKLKHLDDVIFRVLVLVSEYKVSFTLEFYFRELRSVDVTIMVIPYTNKVNVGLR